MISQRDDDSMKAGGPKPVHRSLRAAISALLAIVLAVATVLTSVSPASAESANGFSYEVIDGQAMITGCESMTSTDCPNHITIPSSLGTHSVGSIAPAAFQNAGLTSVDFLTASQVKTIGVNAFSGNSLGSVALPPNLESVGDYAFEFAGVTSLNFGTNSKLETIGDGAFFSNSISSVNIPDSVTGIGIGAFELNQMSSLSFAAESQLETIGNSAFSGNNLETVTIPSDVTSIGVSAFISNELASLTFQSGSQLEEVGNTAFGYNQLESVVIPATVTSLGYRAFFSNELESLSFASGSALTEIGEEVFAENQLTHLTLPSGITSIGAGSFMINKIRSLAFSSTPNLESIGEGAFYLNELTSIVVPAGVASVGAGAFLENSDLDSVRFLGNEPDFGDDVFRDTGQAPIFFSTKTSGWTAGQLLNGRRLTGVSNPVVKSLPKSVKAYVGSKATLRASVTNVAGQGSLTYQWFKNGSLISGARSSAYSASTAGSYSVRVSSWAGTTSSSAAKVTLVKRNQSVKLKLPSRLKRNKTYKLAKTSSAGARVSWKVRGSGKCRIDKRNARIKCRQATGKRHVRIYCTVKGNSKYNSRKFHVNRRVR